MTISNFGYTTGTNEIYLVYARFSNGSNEIVELSFYPNELMLLNEFAKYFESELKKHQEILDKRRVELSEFKKNTYGFIDDIVKLVSKRQGFETLPDEVNEAHKNRTPPY